MDFLLWAARSLHLFAVVVWFGGLMYQAVVTFPVARVEGKELDAYTLHLLRRFQPFVWMSVWTMLVTGFAMLLFSPRFIFLEYPDRWSVFIGLKQAIFVLMLFFAYGFSRMLKLAESGTAEGGRYVEQMVRFEKINIALAIAALLIAAGL